MFKVTVLFAQPCSCYTLLCVLSNLPVVLLIAKEGANISCLVAALLKFSLNFCDFVTRLDIYRESLTNKKVNVSVDKL